MFTTQHYEFFANKLNSIRNETPEAEFWTLYHFLDRSFKEDSMRYNPAIFRNWVLRNDSDK